MIVLREDYESITGLQLSYCISEQQHKWKVNLLQTVQLKLGIT